MLQTATESETESGSFSLAETRHIVRDLFTPKPWIYWTDFLVSLIVGGVCYGLVRHVPAWSLLQAGLFVGSCLLFYRAALFIHEIVHFRSGTFGAFRIVWNLLCGIPFLLPSFTYYTHLDHHRRKHYGTKQDGEYLPLGHQSIWAILFYLSQCFVIPIIVIARFLVLAPLAWFIPPVRRWVHRHASSLVMDPTYVRPLPDRGMMLVWRLQEFGCFVVCLSVAIFLLRGAQPGADPYGPFPLRRGVLPMGFLLQVYLTGVVVMLMNSIRTLGAHRFTSDGREMTFLEQLVDSVNYPRNPLLTGLWAPVGLRFHALHHLFPSLPYHNLAEAHRRLMAELPADSIYRLTTGDSLIGSLRQLLQAARQNRAAARAHSIAS
jgi:fatty acid desaturase